MSEIFIILGLILLNGVFSMSEIALISARKSSLTTDAKKGNKAAKAALKLSGEPDNFLSTVQIGITLIGILTGIYSGNTIAVLFTDWLLSVGVASKYASWLAQGSIVVVVTYLTLILGELVPKRIGLSISEKVAKTVARPMLLLSAIGSPFVWLLAKSTSGIFNLLGISASENKVTEEEIKSMVQEGTEGGEVQPVEQDIVQRVFLTGDLKVSSIMTHKSDLVCMDINMTHQEVKDLLKRVLYEVYPVIDGDMDHVKGVVYLKDLVLYLENEDFKVSDIVKQAVYFHESMNVYKVLEQMKTGGFSRGLVCDEFGACVGMVTLKDIFEALVGNLNDEHEEPDIIKRVDKEGWLVDGQCPFYDFLCYFKREDLYEDAEYTTVAGLILERLEHIPHSGESITWNGFSFEVVDMDGARIDKVLVNYGPACDDEAGI